MDYLCNNEDIPDSEMRHDKNIQCRARILVEIGLNLGIPKSVMRTVKNRRDLCDVVNRKITELDIVTNLLECKKNINIVHLKIAQTGYPDKMEADFSELNRWYNDMQSKAEQTISGGDLKKMVELRNQIKGSCDTFTTGLIQKTKDIMETTNSPFGPKKRNKGTLAMFRKTI